MVCRGTNKSISRCPCTNTNRTGDFGRKTFDECRDAKFCVSMFLCDEELKIYFVWDVPVVNVVK